MKQKEIDEIIWSMPDTRQKFYYFKDRYAPLLLADLIGNGMNIRDLKKSRYKPLTDKPIVKNVLKNCGDQHLSREHLLAVWPQEYTCYLLTLGRWGGDEGWSRFYNQTTRSGWNLVLQMNFSSRHNRMYKKLVQPGGNRPFVCRGHPVAGEGHNTLAWARLDIDLARGEALIEEIQTDWVRLARRSKRAAHLLESEQMRKPYYLRGMGCTSIELIEYVDVELQLHAKIWDEAMLAAAVLFLREQIGIASIYYHTFSSGYQLKRIDGTLPPKSLYSRLPRKFCFHEVADPPEFLLQKNNRKVVRKLMEKNCTFFRYTPEREETFGR